MSEGTPHGEPAEAAPVPPTTVVGYPGPPPVQSAPYSNPGMASLRSQVRAIRYLVVACLSLLVLFGIGLAVGLSSSRAQVEQLSAQLASLGQAASAPAAASAAEAAPSAPAPDVVKQLGPAQALDAGVARPAGVDEAGAVVIGDPAASRVVEVYIDYQCPFCQKWEAQTGRVLAEKAMQPGSDLLLKQYNLAFLRETNPSLTPAGASARAASAAACVLDSDGLAAFVPFSQSLFATADPAEPAGQFRAAALSDLARKAGASRSALACIEAEAQVPFVAATTKSGFGRGVGGTPTVLVDGRTLGNPFTDPELLQLAGAS